MSRHLLPRRLLVDRRVTIAISVAVLIVCVLLLKGRKKEFEFCLSTIVQGSITVSPVSVGGYYVPCGALSSYGWPPDSGCYDFDRLTDLCGAGAFPYYMVPPDSAYLEWGTPDQKLHAKWVKLPRYPRLRPKHHYQVGFLIGYQDCVYVRISSVPSW